MASATDTTAVAEFLRAHPPFDALDGATVERVAQAVEVESISAGTTIFAPDRAPVSHLRVIRSGAVEVVADGRVLDLLGEGELFGHASMLSGLPAGFEARAAEDTLCYRIAVDLAERALSAPAGLRFVARSLLEAPTQLHTLARQPARNLADQPVASVVSEEPVVCAPDTSIRDAARLASDAHATAVVVDGGAGGLGIVTDRDLRSRVLAAGVSVDAPVSEVMSAPVYTCRPDQPAGEALLEMFERGIHHLPVVTERGTVLGVIDATDLLVARTRTSFYMRQRIAVARSVSELVVLAAELRPMVIALHEARVSAANVMAVYSSAVNALTRRLIELELERSSEPGVSFAWLALGSLARGEALPSSDVDSAIVWFGEGETDVVRPRLLELSRAVVDGLARCGLLADAHGASASEAIFVRSLESWQRLVRSWIEQPGAEKALILSSVLVDSRPIWGVHMGTPVSDTFRVAPRSPGLLRLLVRFALSRRPPTGFLRGLVVEHSGEHRGRLDLKHGGVMPIVDLARWAGMAAGVTSASTRQRLRAAAEAGTLSAADAHILEDAFSLISELRAEHQVAQLQTGEQPNDYLDPGELSALMRTQLKEAFRAVAAVQSRLGAEVSLGVR
jgi:CBS domain-containing protein